MQAQAFSPSTPVRAVPLTSCHQGPPLRPHAKQSDDMEHSPTDSLGSPTRRSITAAFAAANESPSLRRKRSSANASLTARPSMLSLREQWSGGSTGGAGGSGRTVAAITSTSPAKRTSTGTSADSQLDELMASLQIGLRGARPTSSSDVDKPKAATVDHPATTEEWSPAVQDLILVHIDQVDGAPPRLGHALFQPNLFVTRRGDVVSIVDHAQWSLLRGTVEETRVVYQNSAKQQHNDGEPSAFDAGRADSGVHSRFYIQARANVGGEEDAALPCELMALTVAGVGSNGTLAPDSSLSSSSEPSSIDTTKFDALPNQLRKLLRQTDRLIKAADDAHADGESSADGIAHTANMRQREQLCNRIVDLVRKSE